MQIDLQFICPSSIHLGLCLFTVHSELHCSINVQTLLKDFGQPYLANVKIVLM